MAAGSIAVPILPTSTPRQLTTALIAAFNNAGLNVQAVGASGTFRIQGTAGPISVTSDSGAVTVSGNSAVGVSPGFGIQIPTEAGALPQNFTDGQTFSITRGSNPPIVFELVLDGVRDNINAIAVVVNSFTPTVDDIARAIATTVTQNVNGLTAVNVGGGRVLLRGDEFFGLDVSGSQLQQFSAPGQGPNTPVFIPLGELPDATIAALRTKFAVMQGTTLPDSTPVNPILTLLGNSITGTERIAESYRVAIAAAGIDVDRADTRLFINGVSPVQGQSVVESQITDEVGNPLLFGEATITIGAGLDFGDAPAPYPTFLQDNGARHLLIDSLVLGNGVTADANGFTGVAGGIVNDNFDAFDDGITVLGAFRPGFATSIGVRLTPGADPSRTFYLDAFFDWNGDGVFGTNEVTRLSSTGNGRLLVADNSQFSVSVPDSAVIDDPDGDGRGTVEARFRLSYDENVTAVGVATGGEVEDYTFTIANNPFRNPSLVGDVNGSGAVTPLDALIIINTINRITTNADGTSNGGIISLTRPDVASLNLPAFPDVNGNGSVSASDALAVINILSAGTDFVDLGAASGGSGEPLAGLFAPVGNGGVMASAATLLSQPEASPRQRTASAEPIAPPPATTEKLVDNSDSVFDTATEIALADVLDSLAADGASASARAVGEFGLIDDIFAGI